MSPLRGRAHRERRHAGKEEDMAQRQVKKMNVALDTDIVPWLEIEAGRRGVSITALINDAVREQRDSAPENVRAVYEAALATRER